MCKFFINNNNSYHQLGVVYHFWKNKAESCLSDCLFFLRENAQGS